MRGWFFNQPWWDTKSANWPALCWIYNGAIQYVLTSFSTYICYDFNIFNMIKSNELISFYALGISKFSVIKTPFIISLIITSFYISKRTPFAYANEYKRKFENFNTIGRISSGMFFKTREQISLYDFLNVTEKAASNIRLLSKRWQNWKSHIHKRAIYDDKKWTFYDENATIFTNGIKLGGDGLKFESRDKIWRFGWFNPEAIERIYKSSNVYSINDTDRSYNYLQNRA